MKEYNSLCLLLVHMIGTATIAPVVEVHVSASSGPVGQDLWCQGQVRKKQEVNVLNREPLNTKTYGSLRSAASGIIMSSQVISWWQGGVGG